MRQCREPLGEDARPLSAALVDLPLSLGRPPARRDALAGEVHDRVDAVEGAERRRVLGSHRTASGSAAAPARDADAVSAGPEELHERTPTSPMCW